MQQQRTVAFCVYNKKDWTGGPLINIFRLTSFLSSNGWRVFIYTYCDGDLSTSLTPFEAIDGVTVRKTHWQVNGEIDKLVRQQIEWLAIDRPDLYVADHYLASLFAARWARESGIATMGYMRAGSAYYQALKEQFICGPPQWQVDGCVCVSSSLRKLVEDHASPTKPKLAVVPSGVPTRDDEVTFTSQGFGVCYVGRLQQEQKRIHETCDLMLQSLRDNACSHVGFIGEGPLRSWVETKRTESGVPNRIHIHGKVDPNLLHLTLKNYNAIVLLSDYEGTPGALMDAMSSGLVPIVLPLEHGTLDLVKHEYNGLVVPERNDSVIRAIECLRSNEDLYRRLSANARKTISEEFALDVTFRNWILFADTLIRERSQHVSSSLKQPLFLNLPEVEFCLKAQNNYRPISIQGRLRALAGRVIRGLTSRGVSLKPITELLKKK